MRRPTLIKILPHGPTIASNTPAIQNAWVKPGACVISVGACRPTQREMDPELVARAVLIVDSRAAALKESLTAFGKTFA